MALFGKSLIQIHQNQQSQIDKQKAMMTQMMMQGMANVNPCGVLYQNALGASGAGVFQEPKRPALKEEQHLVAAVSGWRRWSVAMFGETLMSNNSTNWKPYEKLTAECKNGGCSLYDPAGIGGCKGVYCTCGIYAYKNREAAAMGENSPTEYTHVWGEVWLWGRIVECETGFRAQFAYPKAFVRTGGIADRLAHVYGVKLID